MPKIGNYISVSDTPCDRCNSKKRVAKVWSEKIVNDHGYMMLNHKQIVCTNGVCQSVFEEGIEADNKKRAKLHEIKMDSMARREADRKQSAKMLELTSASKNN